MIIFASLKSLAALAQMQVCGTYVEISSSAAQAHSNIPALIAGFVVLSPATIAGYGNC